MAIIHKATLHPSKLELIGQYLPRQSWFAVDSTTGGDSTTDSTEQPQLLGAYRFDDPDGEVGLETHLVSHAGTVYQLPLSYRGSEMPGGEAHLVGTMEHSVLGTRWVYDACADPVYVRALATAILTGQSEAPQFVDNDGKLEQRASTAAVKGSGTPGVGVPALSPAAPVTENGVTTIDAGELRLRVARVVDVASASAFGGDLALLGTWAGQETPVELAAAHRG